MEPDMELVELLRGLPPGCTFFIDNDSWHVERPGYQERYPQGGTYADEVAHEAAYGLDHELTHEPVAVSLIPALLAILGHKAGAA